MSTLSEYDIDGSIEQFVIQVPTVFQEDDGQTVKDILDGEPDAEGVVVLDGQNPIGIVMRGTFNQKLGTQYGHSLFMKRPVTFMMETDMMAIDVKDRLSTISCQAMGRQLTKVYDYVLVYNEKKYIGVISIRLFLVELSRKNEEQIQVLKQQQQRLINANAQEVQLRRDIEYQSAAVKNLLDHAGQGFLSFGSDLLIRNEYSLECTRIFRKHINAVSFADLMDPFFKTEKRPVITAALKGYFTATSSITDAVYLSLMPSECSINGKDIHLDYKSIESNGDKSVMVVLSDITDKKAMEKAIEDDRYRQRLLLKAITCQSQIKQMMNEFTELFGNGYKAFFHSPERFKQDLYELFRAVHTFKGDLAQYGFTASSEQLHIFENKLQILVNRADTSSLADVEQVMDQMDIAALMRHDHDIISDILGESYFHQDERIAIPKSRIIALEESIQNCSELPDRQQLRAAVRSLRLSNMKDHLAQFSDSLEYLSARIMKKVPAYLVEGDDVEIDDDSYRGFFKSLIHVFRNIMDHGIETDEERVECGKPDNGQVRCTLTHAGDTVTIAISDDGRGINVQKLKAKALENRLYTEEELNAMPPEELVYLIFKDRLSTKDTVDSLSGRGAGLPALKAACEAVGGRVEVASQPNRGTTFTITLPELK